MMCKHMSILLPYLLSFSPCQYILELCRSEQLVEPDFVLSHLDKIKPRHPTLVDVSVFTTFLPLRSTCVYCKHMMLLAGQHTYQLHFISFICQVQGN